MVRLRLPAIASLKMYHTYGILIWNFLRRCELLTALNSKQILSVSEALTEAHLYITFLVCLR